MPPVLRWRRAGRERRAQPDAASASSRPVTPRPVRSSAQSAPPRRVPGGAGCAACVSARRRRIFGRRRPHRAQLAHELLGCPSASSGGSSGDASFSASASARTSAPGSPGRNPLSFGTPSRAHDQLTCVHEAERVRRGECARGVRSEHDGLVRRQRRAEGERQGPSTCSIAANRRPSCSPMS